MFRAISVVLLVLCSGCGGSSSETPFPPEPMDVNLEAEDMTAQDAYKAARPEPAQAEPSRPAEPPPTSKPATTAKPATKPAAPQKETPLF
ncbi:MAG: hypothetical protein HOV80_17925 [Polyangiaceae bacterium]|nr:hypothetical protein [Polyangiaceae bacterium]